MAGFQEGNSQEGKEKTVVKEASQKRHKAHVPRQAGIQALQEVEGLRKSIGEEDAPKPAHLTKEKVKIEL